LIDHSFWLFHDDFLDSFDVNDLFTEGIDDLFILDVQDGILDIAEMFHVVTKAFIMLLLGGLRSFSGGGCSFVSWKLPMNMAHSWSEL
jgi:hypothetical protein